MEGGQKIPINLTAGLDVSSSDMLVPFSQQTFQHNWQKWQGKCLPNSMRFEMDGWAAGWNVYNFEYNEFVRGGVRVEKLSSNMYMAYVYDLNTDAEMLDPLANYRIVSDSKALSGGVEIKRVGNIDCVEGFVYGKPFQLAWNENSHTFSVGDGYADDIEIVEAVVEDGVETVVVRDKLNETNGDFLLREPSVLHVKDTAFAVIPDVPFTSSALNEHVWGDYVISDSGLATPEDMAIEAAKDDGVYWTYDNAAFMAVTDKQLSRPGDNYFEFGYTFTKGSPFKKAGYDGLVNFSADEIDEAYNGKAASFYDGYILNFDLARYYKSFDNLTIADASGSDTSLVSSEAHSQLDVNKFSAIFSDATKSLAPGESVYVAVQIPVWWYCGPVLTEFSPDGKAVYEYKVYQQGVDVTEYYDINATNESELINLNEVPCSVVDIKLKTESKDLRNKGPIWSLQFNISTDIFNNEHEYSNLWVKSCSFKNYASGVKGKYAWMIDRGGQIANGINDYNELVAFGHITGGLPNNSKASFYHLEDKEPNVVVNDGLKAEVIKAIAKNFNVSDDSEKYLHRVACEPDPNHDGYFVYRNTYEKMTFGLAACAVFRGYAALKISYNKLSSEPSLLANKDLLKVEEVGEAELAEWYKQAFKTNNASGLDNVLFVDRDRNGNFITGTYNNIIEFDTTGKPVVHDNENAVKAGFYSKKLFMVTANGKMIDDRQGSGYLAFSVSSTSSSGIFYAVKANAGYMSTGAEDPVNENIFFAPSQVMQAFSIKTGDTYNWQRVDSTGSISMRIAWVPNFFEAPVNVQATLKVNTRLNSRHFIYDKVLIRLQSAKCVVGEIVDNGVRFTVDLPEVLFSEDHELSNSNTSVKTLNFTYANKEVFIDQSQHVLSLFNSKEGLTISDGTITGGVYAKLADTFGYADKGFIPLTIELIYRDIACQSVAVDRAGFIKADSDVVTITDEFSDGSNNTLEYSMQRKRFLRHDIAVTEITKADNGYLNIKYLCEKRAKFSVAMRGVFDGTLDGDTINFTHNDKTYTLDLAEMRAHKFQVGATSVDIRDPKHVKQLGYIDSASQLQLLKQQWCTTEDVENYWWVDNTHILELNSTHFVLKRNTKELSDWDGNRWIEVWSVPRGDIISGDVRKYFVTSAVGDNAEAVFCALAQTVNGVVIRVYRLRGITPFEELGSFELVPTHVDLGETLMKGRVPYANEGRTVKLFTYSQLTPNMLLSKASWSSTCVGEYLLIGCHVTNGFDQWTLIIDLVNFDGQPHIDKLVQGYGYVGLHGDMTGGMIPDEFFDKTELCFSGKVEPLSVLDSKQKVMQLDNLDGAYEINSPYDINDIEQRVVGTAQQQWYLKKRLHGVISHIKVSLAGHVLSIVPKSIPLTNNYEAMYASPSFASSVIGDCMVQITPFADLVKFPNGVNFAWQMVCGFLAYPMLFNFAPRFSSLCYLQQSLGQYAYVHRNSDKAVPVKEPEDSETVKNGFEDNKNSVSPILSSEFIFDKQKVTQTGSTELDYFKAGAISLLISSFSEALQAVSKNVSLNEEVSLNTVKDTGKQFLENMAENASNLLSSAITSQSKNDFGLTSTVTGLKSLDMFYSTSDQQRVFAGPGFTEMQFVAQCVAQSVTDTQAEGRVTQLFMCFKSLTSLQMELALKIEGAIADFLDSEWLIVKELQIFANSIGVPIAMVLSVLAYAIRGIMVVQKLGVSQVDRILDNFAKNGATASTDGIVSRHAISVEGKHKYGEKNEVFMWPCWGVPAGQLKYSDETVACGIKNTPWKLNLRATKYYTSAVTNWANILLSANTPKMSSNKLSVWLMPTVGSSITKLDGEGGVDTVNGDTYRAYRHEGQVPFYQIAPYGIVEERTLPDDMAKIEGVNRFLPNVPFKNENIGVSDPAFAPSLIHDYIIDKDWQLGLCATYGLIQWVTLRDTKVLNGPPSNVIIRNEFCGLASPYAAIEVKRGVSKAYMRPLAITPNVLALNCTGHNALYDDQLYHAFDGMSCRLVDLVGSAGLNKNRQSFYYAIQVNDRFKRSNIIPAQEMQGNFEAEPTIAMETIDPLWTTLTIASEGKGLEAGTVGEDKDAVRWSVPVFTEPVSTLPACVKTLTAATLAVVEGVTGLVTKQVTDTNSAYKAPTSVDFTIGKNVYRATEEYICSVTPAEGGNIITDLIPSLGLKFIGSTPTEAYFYSKATRCYYLFTGSALSKVDMMERFRDIQRGYWDFVNQEVVMPCLMTFKRLNPDVEDTDTETDNVIVPVLSKGIVSGELPPPLTTIFNDRSWYKCLSLPSGFAYQGPNRVIINRAVFTEYMLETMKENLGRWGKVSRERYSFNRKYDEKYNSVIDSVFTDTNGRKRGVNGWTHNPFLLVTSALGVSENTDCMFEWEITFCWPIEMDLLYGPDNYACVNVVSETMTPGGKREARPTHVFLTKELFTRDGSYGYYSFRYQSKNGAGNRERLKIWSDAYIAVSSVTCECKVITQRRTEQLTQQIDVRDMKEL